ncbi:MAG: protein-glutamate O-methyltransferase CheR [Bacteroidales bacterium]|nr:protein-glutamate O-methyltransferase CheR [Bacteroidales bacterium]MCF8454380.1 protein-glutamate O-methyltransferase CheR [Bacteroidales bacterium]
MEIDLLLEGIYHKYGYDFRNYGKAHIKRRLMHRLNVSGLSNFIEMLNKVMYDASFFDKLLLDLSINVTEMFRDPHFYKAVRQEVIPLLRTYPFLKIWHAGCSTGEEVYSMAILLQEEGLYDRTQIYATDFNQVVLKKAKEGIYPVRNIKEYTQNYQEAGGLNSFSDYYNAKYDSAIMNTSLKKNVVFADHNLVQDGVFGEMNLVVCRNVLIYFDRDLQNRVIKLFKDSLIQGGILCLGSKESIKFTEHYQSFDPIVEKEKIFKKIYE